MGAPDQTPGSWASALAEGALHGAEAATRGRGAQRRPDLGESAASAPRRDALVVAALGLTVAPCV